MKLLYDENLPPRLAESLTDLYPESKHVHDLQLGGADDSTLWAYAKVHGFAIVSKDSDFALHCKNRKLAALRARDDPHLHREGRGSLPTARTALANRFHLLLVLLVIAALILASVSLLFVRGSGWRKVAKVIGIAATSVLAVLASFIVLLMWSCQPPSVETLQRRFPKERKDLETILVMLNEDKHLLRIDPTWLMNDQTQEFLQYDPAAGITLERWNEYRRLFRTPAFRKEFKESRDRMMPSLLLSQKGYLAMASRMAIFSVGSGLSIDMLHALHQPQNAHTNSMAVRMMKATLLSS